MGQSRPIDELVVVDDASDDETLEMLTELVERAPFKVHIISQDERPGSTAAFAHGIERATGDVIALADQDDLWYPHKVARLVETFADHPDAAYVFTDAHLVDGSDRPLPGTLWSTRRLTPRLQQAVRQDPFSQLAQRFLVTGCTMAFRADLRSLVLPIPQAAEGHPPLVHDRWISVVLAADRRGGPARRAADGLPHPRRAADRPAADLGDHPGPAAAGPEGPGAPGVHLRRARRADPHDHASPATASSPAAWPPRPACSAWTT